MNYKNIVIAGIVAAIISFVINAVTCGWLFSWVYALEPTSIWKPMTEFPWIASIIGTVIIGIILAAVYAYIHKGLPAESGLKKGVQYGLILWLVGMIPGMYATWFTMTVNNTVIIYWAAQGLIKYLLMGAAIGFLYKE